MAHFAKLDTNNVVTEVIVVNNAVIQNLPFPESESIGVEFCQSLYGANTLWKQTSYNASFRKNYAGFGYSYHADIDAFVAPQPYPSWILNTDTAQWEAPVPYPTDGKMYFWDEPTLSWIEVPE
jgi:hypothetical protein